MTWSGDRSHGMDWELESTAWTEDLGQRHSGVWLGTAASLFLSLRSLSQIGFWFWFDFFFYGYRCICKFIVVAVGGCCGGDRDGFTVDLRRWPQILVVIGQSLGRI